MFISVLLRIGIIFAVLLVGAIARWTKILTRETTDGLCRLAIEVTLPFLYFYTLATRLSREVFLSIWHLPLLAAGLTFISFALSWFFALKSTSSPQERKTFIFLGAFGNYGFLAIPVVYALFGEEGLVMISIFNIGVAFLYWTLGLSILTGIRGKGILIFKNLRQNSIFALILGAIVGISALPIPKTVLEISKLIGDTSIVLALIVVGSLLAHRDSKKAFPLKAIISLAVCRLLVIPALVLVFASLLPGLEKLVVALLVLQAAMPSASTTPILTSRFSGDTDFAANGVFFTTLLSIVTIPLWMSIILR